MRRPLRRWRSCGVITRYLKDLGELDVGAAWDRLENRRQGALYAYADTLKHVEDARAEWLEVRTWALS